MRSNYCGRRRCHSRTTSGCLQHCSRVVQVESWSCLTSFSCGIILHSHLWYTTRPQPPADSSPTLFCCGCRTGCGRYDCSVPVLLALSIHRPAVVCTDIDRYYNLVMETLICTKCRTSYLSWGQAILRQLDLAHRSEFRVILTRRYITCRHAHIHIYHVFVQCREI